MRRYEPKTRYKISKSQELVLLYLHKYRFMTSDLLAEGMYKDRSTIYERLSVLEQQGHIAKQYDSTFRIRQRAATYCLAPAGIRHLKQKGVSRTQLHYKNKNLTEKQIDQQLLYVRLWFAINHSSPGKFTATTKYQLEPDGYVSPTPHLLLEGTSKTIPDYFIEIFPALTASWKIRRRVNQHMEAADESKHIYPHLLLVASNASTERRIAKMTADLYADFAVYTTTTEWLFSGDRRIWQNTEDYDEDDRPSRTSLPLKYEQ